jgi:hypothetical protein
MTEKTIMLTAKLLEARDAMRRIFGNAWGLRVAELEEIIIARRRVTSESKLESAIACAKIAQSDGQASLAVQFLAAACELEAASTTRKAKK